MNSTTDFPCSHPANQHKVINGVVVCQLCHAALSGNEGRDSLKITPHRADFMAMDLPAGYRAGYANEQVEPGKGFEALLDEEWIKMDTITDRYRLTQDNPKHRIKVERRIEDRRHGGSGQEGGEHYKSNIDPWELQREMKSSGDAFVDARRADAIKYAWRMKGDKQKLLEDLKKAKHCIEAAITQLSQSL